MNKMMTSLLCASTAMLSSPLSAQDNLPPLDAYGELPIIEDVALSDSGSYIAVFGKVGGDIRKLVITDINLKPQRVVNGDDIKFRGLQFAGDSSVLMYRTETVNTPGFAAAKYELMQAIRVPVSSQSEIKAVFGGNRRLNNAVHGNHGLRKTDKGVTGYFGAIEYSVDSISKIRYHFNHGRPALYGVNLSTMSDSKVAGSPPEGVDRDWMLGPDGSVVAKFDYKSANGKWSITNENGDKLAEGMNPLGDVGMVGLGADGSTLIYSLQTDDSDERKWFEVSLAGGAPREFLKDIDPKRIYWNRYTGEYLGYLADTEKEEMVFVDPAVQQKMAKVRKSFGKLRPRIMEWTPDYSKMIVRTDGSGDSGTWFIVDIDNKIAKPVGYERPKIAPAWVGKTSTIEYTAQDGMEMDGILTLPPGKEAKNLPVVVFPHGGPHSYDDESFDWWSQAFASRGYAVFQPNFRGSTGRDQSFADASHGEWGRKMQTDISDGLKKLVDDGIVDPKRACIMGASYGGYAALAGVTIQNGLYRCAVSVAGVSDLNLMYSTDVRESGRDKALKLNLKEELGPKSGWDAVSPRDQAAKADAPILLIHGKDDTVVDYRQSTKMADALKDAGKPYEMVTLKEEDHWLSLPETRKAMLRAAMAFVQTHNPAN